LRATSPVRLTRLTQGRRPHTHGQDPLRNLAAIALPVALTQSIRGLQLLAPIPRRPNIHGVVSSMTAGPEASRAIVGAMVGLPYGSVLALLSLFLFGGGGAHGTSVPLLLSSAPLGVFALVGKLVGEPYMGYGHNATVLGAPLVWAGLGWLVALSGRGRLRLSRIWLCCTMRPGSRSSRRQARSRAVWSAWCKYRRSSLCGRRSTWLGKRRCGQA
jgi:hypothetical protein